MGWENTHQIEVDGDSQPSERRSGSHRAHRANTLTFDVRLTVGFQIYTGPCQEGRRPEPIPQ